MNGFAHRNMFSKRARRLYREAVRLVRRLPEALPGEEEIRCHEVARVIGRALDLPVVDGLYGACDHSWLAIECGADRHLPMLMRGTVILDVYSVYRVPMVQLVYWSWKIPNYYHPGPERTDVRIHVVEQLSGALGTAAYMSPEQAP